MGACPGLRVMGLGVLEFCDKLTAQYMLPLGAFLTCLFVGWFVPQHIVHSEYTNDGTLHATFYRAYLFSVRFICPICIFMVFLHQLGVI